MRLAQWRWRANNLQDARLPASDFSERLAGEKRSQSDVGESEDRVKRLTVS